VKFKGEHGEVNIVFELYQFQLGAWRRLDSWQPDMTVPGKAIHEMYTYTIHGLHDGETMRHFRKRLRDDMTYLLTEMVQCTPPATAPAPGTATQTQANMQAAPRAAMADVGTDEMGLTQQSQPPVSFAKTTQTSLRPVPPPDGDTARAKGEPNGVSTLEASQDGASDDKPQPPDDDASVFDTVPNPTNNNHNP